MRATFLLFFLGGLLAMPVQAADVQAWVKRLTEGQQRQSFQGTFVYERNGIFSTHEVWRLVEPDGSVREHWLQLDGPRQEVVKRDGVTQCIAGGMAGQLGAGQLWPVRKLVSDDLASWYDIRMVGQSRIAGRAATVIGLIPRDQYRYGFELHLDQETGLPLKSLLLNDKGQPLERLQFTQFSTAAPDDSGLQPSEACQAVPAGKPDAPVASSWRSEWVPPGFTLNNTYERRSPVSDDSVVSMDYGDGLARFSIFIEPLHGARIDDARTQLGPTSVVSKRLNTEDGGMMVTVVGEIPTGTAERIAMSVRPQAPAQGAAAQ
ncbi:MucB/RseB C-terminal domain-containing protein [Pseudomonas citronellolis]|uniref:MucB/RseB C-terminal domain-containing protein n=1 Tax=Pseudomonas citronellolis TaxID=53408 RepID=UPI000778BD4B|nr:MucB/RseB C-terminal domain-containing protein [Pseudomonas citronellolis]AMO78294.1 Sigma factor AlgU regulatory protein MucB precursor [Pseudomonas citronellolis]